MNWQTIGHCNRCGLAVLADLDSKSPEPRYVCSHGPKADMTPIAKEPTPRPISTVRCVSRCNVEDDDDGVVMRIVLRGSRNDLHSARVAIFATLQRIGALFDPPSNA